jgi:hypothetical protein
MLPLHTQAKLTTQSVNMCVRAPILSCAGEVEAKTFDGKQCISIFGPRQYQHSRLRTRRLLHTSNVTNRFALPPRSRMVAAKCMVPRECASTLTHWHPVPVQARPAAVCSKKSPARLPMRCLCKPVQPSRNRSQHVATNPTTNRSPLIQPCRLRIALTAKVGAAPKHSKSSCVSVSVYFNRKKIKVHDFNLCWSRLFLILVCCELKQCKGWLMLRSPALVSSELCIKGHTLCMCIYTMSIH